MVLEWASASEAPRFVTLITNFVEQIKDLGPLGEKEGLSEASLRLRLEAARVVTGGMRFRAALGNLARELKKAGDYSPEGIARRVEEKILPLLKKEILENELKALLEKGPISVDALAEKTGFYPGEIASLLQVFSKRGQVVQEGDLWQPKARGNNR